MKKRVMLVLAMLVVTGVLGVECIKLADMMKEERGAANTAVVVNGAGGEDSAGEVGSEGSGIANGRMDTTAAPLLPRLPSRHFLSPFGGRCRPAGRRYRHRHRSRR